MLEGGAGAAKATVEGDVEHEIPLLVGHVDNLGVAPEPGVVHQDVDVPHLLHGKLEHRLDVVFFADVADDCFGPNPGLGFDFVGRFAEPPLVDVADHQARGVFFGAANGCCEPDACAGSSGDENGLAFEQAVPADVRGFAGHRGSFGSPSPRSPMMFR